MHAILVAVLLAGAPGPDLLARGDKRVRDVGICVDHWCWDFPRPQGMDLYGAWADGSTAWAVGDWGTILRFEKGEWKSSPAPTTSPLAGVWASGPADAWAVGPGVVLRWNGTAWKKSLLEGKNSWLAVWGSAADDVWIGGRGVQRWDGKEWTAALEDNGVLVLDLDGTGRGRSWALAVDDKVAGPNLLAMRFTGKTWQRWSLGAALPVAERALPPGVGSIVALSDSDVWVTAENVAPMHFDGNKWAPAAPAELAAGGVPVMVVDKREWPDVLGVWGKELLLAGPRGRSWAFDGKAWRDAGAHATGPVLAMAPSTPGTWAVGGKGLLERWQGSWVPASEHLAMLTAVGGSAPDDAWIMGPGLTRHFDGTRWTEQKALPGAPAGIWFSSRNDGWVAGEKVLAHWTGKEWKQFWYEWMEGLRGIWGSAPDDVWAGGTGGFVIHWDGKAWVRTSSQVLESDISHVGGTSASDVWFVSKTELAHWDGKAFKREPVPWSKPSPGAILAFSAGKAGTFVGGDGGLFKRAGAGWEQVLSGVAVGRVFSGEADVWAVTFEGPRHFNGVRWLKEGPPKRLDAFWGAGGHAFGISWDGAAMHYRP